MKLLTEEELIGSAVVANNRMNRERNASGINSYEKELRFQPEQYLRRHLGQFGHVKWLDVCCGEGKALLQSAIFLADNDLQHRATLRGIDLIDGFSPIPSGVTCLQWQVGSIVNWTPVEHYDLITCVHGLHYVGDKLQVIRKACQALTENGIFLAHLDLENIKIDNRSDSRWLTKKLKEQGVAYNVRRKTIVCNGRKQIDFSLVYQGASDLAGPNYTGQEAVNSYYITQG